GAVASPVFCASGEQGKNLELGNLEMLTSEFSSGKIFASSFGSMGVLTLIFYEPLFQIKFFIKTS
ncbi:MAG: hypothetical protein ACW991_08835, partial [Candidatus Hodarchaeales archaeon]